MSQKQVKVIMFDVLPGRSLHIPEMQPGMLPTVGYDSHDSANHMEWYLFDESQCVPRYILTIRAFQNRRTAEDDEKADADTSPPAAPPGPKASGRAGAVAAAAGMANAGTGEIPATPLPNVPAVPAKVTRMI
jgi:hypothetical protein